VAATVVNQWSGSYAQLPVFGYSIPSLASLIIPLTPASSAGAGTGTPTAGNWLFVIAGWRQEIAGVTATLSSVGDDTHQWWRPMPASDAGGHTRTAIWYQPNIIPPGNVYVAPTNYCAGLAALVVEVSGLAPWDLPGGYGTSFSNSATSLALSADPASATPPVPALLGTATISGAATAVIPVAAATVTTDALIVSAGTDNGTITSVTDSKSNTYTQVNNATAPATVVQQASGGTTGTSLTLTFGQNTTPGNAVIIAAGGYYAGSISGITLGGTAGFTHQVGSGGFNAEIWADLNITQASTTLTLTASTAGIIAYAYEIAPAVAGGTFSLGQTAGTYGAAASYTTWSSGAPAATTGTSQFWIGYGIIIDQAGNITGPGDGRWVNSPPITHINGNDLFSLGAVAGYQRAAATGQAAAYSGTSAPTPAWAAVTATFIATGTAPVSIAQYLASEPTVALTTSDTITVHRSTSTGGAQAVAQAVNNLVASPVDVTGAAASTTGGTPTATTPAPVMGGETSVAACMVLPNYPVTWTPGWTQQGAPRNADGTFTTAWQTGTALTPVTASAAAASQSWAMTVTTLRASPQSSFFIGATTTNQAGTQAFLPSGWTALAQTTASNGVDTTSTVVINAACTTASARQSVSGTVSPAAVISGALLSVLVTAPSPVASTNPNWPYLVFEAAFGSGYQTPPDQMTWTSLQTRALSPRLRRWQDSTGVQYELAALEASETSLFLDNPDGALSPFNPASPYYPDVLPGTPVRIRAVPPASTGVNRWYVFARNMERWPQSWDEIYRGQSNATGTDCWSVINKLLPTCYRAEVLADSPYAWWPCDDSGVNRAITLINAAPGNDQPLAVTRSPQGLNASVTNYPWSQAVVYSAIDAFSTNTGWMYGDPVSATWQQTGVGLDNTGWYLYCQDPGFPNLPGGVTIEGWWSFPFQDTGGQGAQQAGEYTQPGSKLLLWQMFEVASLQPVAALQLDVSTGAPDFITYNSGFPTSNVLTNRNKRDTTWFGVTISMNSVGWQAVMNGGGIAQTSGSFTFSPAFWNTLYVGAEYDAGGVDGIGNYAVGHIAVYPYILPAARVAAHFNAAYSAFGQLPAPQIQADFYPYPETPYAPDGTAPTGTFFGPPASGKPSTLAAVASSTISSFYSTASYPTTRANVLPTDSPGYFWLSFTGAGTGGGSFAVPRTNWFTSAGEGAQLLQATNSENYTYCNSFGTGAAYPTTPAPLGDTVQYRIERLLGAGFAPVPRCIDPAPAPCLAALDTGGQACGDAINNIVASDGGLMFVDNVGNLCYWQQSHLAAMPVAWNLGPNIAGGQIPYLNDATWDTDPQRILNDIEITQYDIAAAAANAQSGLTTGSGEQAGGLVFAPAGAYYEQVLASQEQYGDCQYQITSYLQSTVSIQNQANWLFSNFGTPVQRITNLTVQAAAMTRSCPQAWVFVLGANVGDVITVTQHQPGQPAFTGTWRISHIERTFSFGEQGEFTAAATIIGDYYTASYWS